MDKPKPRRRKIRDQALEPIDWHEFANDAVLQGNMSTLYHRPPTEDPSAYASPEALIEIEKRAGSPRPKMAHREPAVSDGRAFATEPTVGIVPTGGIVPTVGTKSKKRIKPIRGIQDVLTLAGQILYKAMYGASDDLRSKSCTKGYRQLASEAHLDKDTVRDLISEFKVKGIVRETGTYDPDTRLAKTYDVLSQEAILEVWREAGILFVTAGRQRPMFCTAEGVAVSFIPTVGPEPSVGV